jgi:hypothetical protein
MYQYQGACDHEGGHQVDQLQSLLNQNLMQHHGGSTIITIPRCTIIKQK